MITKMQLVVFGIVALLALVNSVVATNRDVAAFGSCIGCAEDEVAVGDIANDTGQPIIEGPTEPDDINPGNTSQ
jgi:hypothetical protein